MADYATGRVGLGVMGRNLPFDLEETACSMAAYDAWPETVDRFSEEGKGKNVQGFKDVAELVNSLPAGKRAESAP
jgi:6-phosphogluconate dehydrogenase